MLFFRKATYINHNIYIYHLVEIGIDISFNRISSPSFSFISSQSIMASLHNLN